MGQVGFVKKVRGIFKQFIPYGMERRYILGRYGMTEPWDPLEGRGVLCALRDMLPYGLVRGYLRHKFKARITAFLPRLTRLEILGLGVLRRFCLLSEKRYLLLRDYLIVEGSGCFDEQWYRKEYLDASSSQVDCIWHYCTTGRKKAYRPSSEVDGHVFQECYPVSWNRNAWQECAATKDCPHSHNALSVKAKEPVFPRNARAVIKEFKPSRRQFGRVAVFAAFSQDGTIPETTLYYLKGMQRVVDDIIFVADNPLLPGEVDKLAGLVAFCQCERHGEYDFGSYKRGWRYLMANRYMRDVGEVVFCNDSCYGPVVPFERVFDSMRSSDVDFWGLVGSRELQWHLQSYFWVLKRKVFTSRAFADFIQGVRCESSVREVVLGYEVPFTQKMIDAGFTASSYIFLDVNEDAPPRLFSENPTAAPIYCLEHGSPLVKAKAIKCLDTNYDGVGRTIDAVYARNPVLGAMLEQYRPSYKGVEFSVILPTYNRVHSIDRAIDAMLNQTYQEFELIIVDDGSTDGTEAHVREKYGKFIERGTIKYFYGDNVGVCKARNRGLRHASKEWIAYVDSDNIPVPTFLELMAQGIVQNPDARCFYARFRMRQSRRIIGKPFSFNALLAGNYIDLGTFVHHRSVYERLGGFDERMTRLVDWDLIIRYTEKFTPVYLNQVVLLYDDSQKADRISVKVNYAVNLNLLRSKRQKSFIVTTVITTYNHRDFIEAAIRSALKQKGDFVHEILVSDDGSTDGTREIIREMARNAPTKIRDISSDVNIGVSANLRKCFAEASGKYIAILEGDDYWLWDTKLARQVEFMEKNPDCTMVFSRLNILNQVTGKCSFLPRQNGLSERLTGEDFIRDPNQNLIANFSSCMFKAKIAKEFPEILYSTRFTEIACAFYIEKLGPIGFINLPMSTYRLHPNGIWSAGDKKKKLVSAIKTREVALKVCAPQYRERMQLIIDGLKSQLDKLQEAEEK